MGGDGRESVKQLDIVTEGKHGQKDGPWNLDSMTTSLFSDSVFFHTPRASGSK